MCFILLVDVTIESFIYEIIRVMGTEVMKGELFILKYFRFDILLDIASISIPYFRGIDMLILAHKLLSIHRIGSR